MIQERISKEFLTVIMAQTLIVTGTSLDMDSVSAHTYAVVDNLELYFFML